MPVLTGLKCDFCREKKIKEVKRGIIYDAPLDKLREKGWHCDTINGKIYVTCPVCSKSGKDVL